MRILDDLDLATVLESHIMLPYPGALQMADSTEPALHVKMTMHGVIPVWVLQLVPSDAWSVS